MFVVRAGEELRACPDCGVILPAGEAWGHESPCKAVPCYSHGKKRFIQLRKDSTKPVHLLMWRDPGDVLARVQGWLWAVAAGNDSGIPTHAYPWLDELQQVYEDEDTEQEPTDWLLGLIPVLQRMGMVRNRIERGSNGDEEKLAEWGRQVRRYRSALDVLYRWLRSEAG
ncbi:MAG: hypothetical protein M3P49_04310 [Actinomycetota bacterium]|nr:hypothetical protein [Actinomycetota bacterium]